MSKVVDSPQAAVADIPSGSTIAIAGFGVGHRFPSSLIMALRDHGVGDLCIVCNSLGKPGQARAQVLVENGQVRKLVAAFTARPGMKTIAEEQIAAGTLAMELVPQGTLVERLRAAGAGIPAFYTPTGVGTDIARDKELRTFGGRDYILEHALPVDYALLRGQKADRFGNVRFRGGSQNFNPSFAKASRVAIVEVDEIVADGELEPNEVDLPGIFITKVVATTVHVDLKSVAGQSRRGADTSRTYNGKTALTRQQIAQRAAALLKDGAYVNLGSGLPTLISDYVHGRGVVLHAENGILGYGATVPPEEADPDYYNAGGGFVSLKPGASFFDSVTSFEMARGGRLDTVVLGGYQVDQAGDLANWSTPGMVGGGIGGAMDLVANAASLIVTMEHCDSHGQRKLVRECTYPITGRACVDVVVTDLALLRRQNGRWLLEEIAAGFTAEEVLALTDIPVEMPSRVGVLQHALPAA